MFFNQIRVLWSFQFFQNNKIILLLKTQNQHNSITWVFFLSFYIDFSDDVKVT
jgi:hypothetical protein